MPDGDRIRVRLMTPKAMDGCAAPVRRVPKVHLVPK